MLYPEEVRYWNAEILQISVYRGMKDNLRYMRECVSACRAEEVPFVIHPVKYSLLDEETAGELTEMAGLTDRGLIIHDERASGGERIRGEAMQQYRSVLEGLGSITPVSIENAADTGDIHWFWDTFAGSITLDIGHIESFGLDSRDFVKDLDREYISRVRFVHMHRNNGLRGGITDHWPLTADCNEVAALRDLVRINPDVSVILEINEVDQTGQSLDILRAVRDEVLG